MAKSALRAAADIKEIAHYFVMYPMVEIRPSWKPECSYPARQPY
jgi:hypothetical protein